MPGDTATAYMDGQEVASLPDDSDGRCLWAPSTVGGKVQQGMWVGLRAPKEGMSRETTRERSLLERRVAELRTHKKGVLIVQRTAAGGVEYFRVPARQKIQTDAPF